MNNIAAVLTDIEGTTSSLSFVKDVLFPYAREHLGDYVRAHREEERVRQVLTEVQAEAGQTLDLEAAIAQLEGWIDEDRKVTPLKTLQGWIWEAGYRDGAFHGHLYEDAWRTLRAWHEAGKRLYVFSSGSVYAQKLLFAHTAYGDLTGLFSGYYDTHIGNKREQQAYARIADDIGLTPVQVLFLSDIREELDAAALAGMQTCWLVRGQAPQSDAAHRQVSDFDQISIA